MDDKKLTTNPSAIIKAIENLQESITEMNTKIDKVAKRVTDIEVNSKGGDSKFEDALNKESDYKFELTEAEKVAAGTPADEFATAKLRKLFRSRDFKLWSRSKDGLPMTDFTLHVPEYISGYKRDLRTRTVQNHLVNSELTKWFEQVKTQIRRDWVLNGKGEPNFHGNN